MSAFRRFSELGSLAGADLIARVAAELEAMDPSRKGTTYSLSAGNTLPAGWLIHSPAQAQMGAPPALPASETPEGCTGSELLAAIRDLLHEKVAAQPDQPHFIDISQLGNHQPEDAFQAELIATIVECARGAQQDIVIRYLEGNQEPETVEKGSFYFPRNLVEQAKQLAPPYRVRFYAANLIHPWFTPDAQGGAADHDWPELLRRQPGADASAEALLGWLEKCLAWLLGQPEAELEALVAELLSALGHPSWIPTVDQALREFVQNATSINHSKIVAVDGESVITGGQNLWQVYCGATAPHDLSMRMSGPAAVDAHRFLNQLWSYTNGPHEPGRTVSWSFTLGDPAQEWGHDPAPLYEQPSENPGSGAIPALAVGNLGLWGSEQSIPFLASFVYALLFDSVKPENTYPCIENAPNPAVAFPFTATSSFTPSERIEATQASVFARNVMLSSVAPGGHIRISQQKIAETDALDVLGLVLWTGHLLDVLADALVRQEARVDILVSYHQPVGPPVYGYSDDMGAAALRGVIAARARARFPDASGLAAALERLTVKQTPNLGSGNAMYNHAKVWIVDERVFYIGSDNIYPGYLQEFGYVVGDAGATRSFIREYWDPIWSLAVLPS